MKTALIKESTGPSGAHLAELPLSRGYRVRRIKRRWLLYRNGRRD